VRLHLIYRIFRVGLLQQLPTGKEQIMVICPKCKAENRPEAAFCVRCGTILFSRPSQEKIDELPTPFSLAQQSTQTATSEPIAILSGFTKRPEGSMFGDRFQYDSLVIQEEHEIQYTIKEVNQPTIAPVQVCSNPSCRTIHCPIGVDVEKFCTQCGQPLETQSPTLLLKEADIDKFASMTPMIDLHLVHPNIHPPVAIFQQNLLGATRYCLVTPLSKDLPNQPSMTEVLDWGGQLSQALDYMQAKGVVLGEELDQTSIGLADGKVVWRNFASTRILPILTDRDKINNVRQLALAMYFWMTGKTTYSLDPYLPVELNELFQKALVGEGFTSGAEFEKQINQAKSTEPRRLNLDFQVGRRSHPGRVRTNNEDSLLSIEVSRMNEGVIQPISLVAVADGMGGHASGEQASSLVIDAIAQIGAYELVKLQNPSYDEFGEWIKRATQAANQAVYEARQNAGNDMGSTLVLGLIVGSQAYLGHSGDSRIYLVNRESIKQLSTDHSLVQHLVSIGKITQDEARVHPQRNIIYRSLGEKPEVEADYFNQQLFPDDRLLFCSDGLSSLVDDQKIQKIILDASSAQAACDLLIDEANAAGGEDNISVLLIEVLSY
jgi:serine/threonine protein phosphatase PrpC